MQHAMPQESFNAADYFLDRNIRQGKGHKVAIYTEHRNYTYNDMQKMANKTANGLRNLGVGIEDRVMILMLDVPQFWAIFWGSVKIGAIPIPINTMMTAEDYEFYLNDSRARLLVISEELLPIVNQIKGDLPYLRDMIVISETDGARIPFRQQYKSASALVKTAPTTRDDVGFWLYSSGSTGAPKGAIHSQYDMVVCCKGFGDHILKLTEDDVCFSSARLFFAYGLGNSMYFPMHAGAAVLLSASSPKPEGVLNILKKFRPTVYFGVPTLYGQILAYQEKLDKETGVNPDPNADHSFSSVRICISAGEALPPEIFHRFKERYGLEILDCIGSTEMAHMFIANRPGEVKPGSTGKPVPGYELKIVDDEGNELPQGEIGTLMVKGDSAAQFYWRKREKSRQTMVGEWINTGDKYYIDDEGYYHAVGRSDDMLKVGGIWVSPVEVESCLIEHPAVFECAVVGHVDEKFLVKPKAFVVLNDKYKPGKKLEEELKKWVLDRMAKFKYPRWIEFLDALPKSATGKIQRFKLRQD